MCHYNLFIDIVIKFKFKNATVQEITSVTGGAYVFLQVKSVVSTGGIYVFFTGKKITTMKCTYKKCTIGVIYNRYMLRLLGAAPSVRRESRNGNSE